MDRWHDFPEMEAAVNARKYRPPWLRRLRALNWALLLTCSIFLVLDITGRWHNWMLRQVIFFVALACFFWSNRAEVRWKRQHPEAG